MVTSLVQKLPNYCEFMRSQGWGWDVLAYTKSNPLPAKNNKYLSDIEFIVFYSGQASQCSIPIR